jgi:hypothetical protein
MHSSTGLHGGYPPQSRSSPNLTIFPLGLARSAHSLSHMLHKHQSLSIPQTVEKPRALLLTKDKKIPLLWKVLGNKYKGQIELGTHRDHEGKTSEAMGYEAGGKKQGKVLIYPVGSTNPVRYEGSYVLSITRLHYLTNSLVLQDSTNSTPFPNSSTRFWTAPPTSKS